MVTLIYKLFKCKAHCNMMLPTEKTHEAEAWREIKVDSPTLSLSSLDHVSVYSKVLQKIYSRNTGYLIQAQCSGQRWYIFHTTVRSTFCQFWFNAYLKKKKKKKKISWAFLCFQWCTNI